LGVLLAVSLALGAGCLQLESPRTLAEEEDLRVRGMNTTQKREELEEKIRRELDHIRLLQNSLELTLTREEALHNELEKQKGILETTKKDKASVVADMEKMNGEVAQKQQELEQLKTRAKELANSLTAERNRIAATEEILKRDSRRIEDVWLQISRSSAELEQLRAEESRLGRELEAGRERIWRSRQLLNEADAALTGDRKALVEIKKRIEKLLQDAPVR
jgi:chromosome segregation ATPase